MGFERSGLGIATTGVRPNETNRPAPSRVLGAAPGVVLSEALLHLGRHAGVVSAVGAFEEVARPILRHAQDKPFDSLAGSRSDPSTRPDSIGTRSGSFCQAK